MAEIKFAPNSEGAQLVVTSVKLGFAITALWAVTNLLFFGGIVCSIIAIVNLFLHGGWIGFGFIGLGAFVVSTFLEKVWDHMREVQAAVLKKLVGMAVDESKP